MNPNETAPEAMSNEQLADLIGQTVRNVVNEETTTLKTDLRNELVPKTTSDNGLVPAWMEHTRIFLNAGVAFARDEKAKAETFVKEYNDQRSKLTDGQKNWENNEATRIIKDAGLRREAQTRALSTLTGAEGGFLLPKPFFAEVFVRIESFGAARRYFRSIPMGSKDLDLKNVATKPVVNWAGELTRIATTDITFAEPKLVAKKLAALLPWSSELEEDEVFGVISLAAELFAEAIARKEDEAGFMGAGSGDTANGEFTGLFNVASNVPYVMTGRVSFEDLTSDDLSKVIHKLSLKAKTGAVWFMNHTITGIVQRLKDNEGRPIYQFPNANAPGNIFGYPVVELEVGNTADQEYQNDRAFIAFGNPTNMLFGNRRNVTFDISRDAVIRDSEGAVTLSAFQDDAAIARITERIGFATPLAKSFAVIKTAATT